MQAIRKILHVELSIVFAQKDLTSLYTDPVSPGYRTQRVREEDFHKILPKDLIGIDFSWAFARGDYCVGNLKGEVLVGWDFWTQHPTLVCDGLYFRFPSSLLYSFASFTHRAHRGKRLAAARGSYSVDEFLAERNQLHPFLGWVWYIDCTNYESLRLQENAQQDVRRVGWTAAIRFFGHYYCFSSRACRKFGTVFEPAD